MSGFLRRLAARATGQAAPIHAAFPSPVLPSYVEPALAWTEAVPASDAPGGEAMTARQPELAPIPASSRKSPIEPRHVAFGTEAVSTRRMLQTDAGCAEPESPSPTDSAPTVMLHPPAAGHMMGLEAAPRAVQGPPPLLFSEPARTLANTSPSDPRPVSAAPPAPLLPLEAPARARPFAGMPSTANPARQYRPGPAVEETTEVHVSIGRIEVTAVHEAPPRRPAPKANRPMSLDEYLTKREVGR